MRVNRVGHCALLCGLLAASCASSSRIQRQALPDGSYRLDCRVTLAQCLTAVEDVCPQGYDIVRAHQDVRVAGPREISEPTVTGEAVARCRYEQGVFGGAKKAAEPPAAETAASAPANAAPAPAPASAAGCFPGATQACVGPGACQGGQQCLANGTAFGPCDCGGALPAPPAPPPPVAPGAAPVAPAAPR
jgi:hypothetical protein